MAGQPMQMEFPVSNTFIQYPVESMRPASLEEFIKEREAKSCPTSGILLQGLSGEEIFMPAPPGLYEVQPITKNTFIDFPAIRSPSLEEYMKASERQAKSCPTSAILQESETVEIKQEYEYCSTSYGSTAGSTATASPRTPSGSDEVAWDAPVVVSPPQLKVVSLSAGLGLMNPGSMGHEAGACKPCAFLWKSAEGCKAGDNCGFCHVCPPGELKARKKEKVEWRKMARGFKAQALRFGMF